MVEIRQNETATALSMYEKILICGHSTIDRACWYSSITWHEYWYFKSKLNEWVPASRAIDSWQLRSKITHYPESKRILSCKLSKTLIYDSCVESTSPEAVIMTAAVGFPLWEPWFSITLTISMPSTTSPKTTCLSSNWPENQWSSEKYATASLPMGCEW